MQSTNSRPVLSLNSPYKDPQLKRPPSATPTSNTKRSCGSSIREELQYKNPSSSQLLKSTKKSKKYKKPDRKSRPTLYEKSEFKGTQERLSTINSLKLFPQKEQDEKTLELQRSLVQSEKESKELKDALARCEQMFHNLYRNLKLGDTKKLETSVKEIKKYFENRTKSQNSTKRLSLQMDEFKNETTGSRLTFRTSSIKELSSRMKSPYNAVPNTTTNKKLVRVNSKMFRQSPDRSTPLETSLESQLSSLKQRTQLILENLSKKS